MIYCILGQTATGKTSLALKLAKEYHLPIISCDAYQCYKVMQIGTDKPKREEVKGVSYYFYDEYDVDTVMSVYLFQKECSPLLEFYQALGKDVILVGGTFLYVKALLYGFNFEKEQGDNPYLDMDIEELKSLLLKRDKETYESIDHENPRRLIRALVHLDNGKSQKDILNSTEKECIYPAKFFIIDIDKDEGNDKIDKRVDLMFQSGFVDEVKRLLKTYPRELRSFKAIGYPEITDALIEGREVGEDVKNLIKTHTHQYAKKQRTFLRNQFSKATRGSLREIEEQIRREMEGICDGRLQD